MSADLTLGRAWQVLSDLLRARNILARSHVVAANDNLRGNRDTNPMGDA